MSKEKLSEKIKLTKRQKEIIRKLREGWIIEPKKKTWCIVHPYGKELNLIQWKTYHALTEAELIYRDEYQHVVLTKRGKSIKLKL